jgi:Heavy-metal resistance
VKVIRHGRGWHGYRRGWGGGYGYGPRAGLRFLFERLDTSPGQEKVILGVVEDVWRTKREVGEEFVKSRGDVARAMRGERFDEAALDEAFARQDALLAKMRATMKAALTTVHEALDERQRKVAGDMLEGQIFAFGRGHGRCGHRHHGFDHGDGPTAGGPYRTASV